MDIKKKITQELGIRPAQTEAVIQLIDEGNTIPFISRYRKDVTGGMNDEILRAFDERLKYLRNLEDRKATVIASIEEQEKMTPELRRQIDAAETAVAVEDLYRPYKPKRRTRATIAMEKGVAGLADYIRSHAAAADVETEATKYISEEKGVADTAAAIQYAQDIIAGEVSDNAEYRTQIRNRTRRKGVMVSTATKDGEGNPVYANYADFQENVHGIPGHRVLAMNRGEKEKMLSVHIEAPEETCIEYLQEQAGRGDYLSPALEDSYRRLIAPSIETEIRNELTEAAQEGAIKIFGSNLEQLLMQPPLAGKTVLGWDPAFRTGCKLAVCDSTGKILATTVIFPTAPQNKVAEAKRVLAKLVQKYDIDVISVGNGTASRESEQIIADFIHEYAQAGGKKLQYVIVNEAGASVYSASKLATEEYPDLDVGERSSASIARRLQDPLSELVKIDPKSIGVGQYQHDMNQKKLGEALNAVVEDCVNKVGVDLNTASPSLLEYVSGISKTVAANIVRYREENGRFRSRKELLKVPKLGPKAYEQCAGFLRIVGGTEPLDATAVHPESYDAALQILATLGYTEADLTAGGIHGLSSNPKLSGGKANAAAGKSGKDAANGTGAGTGSAGGNVATGGKNGNKQTNGAVNGKAGKSAGEPISLRGNGKNNGKISSFRDLQALSRASEKAEREKRQNQRRQRGGAGAAGATGAAAAKAEAKPQISEAAVRSMAEQLGIGEYTCRDILEELEKPGRDPRSEAAAPILRSDVMEIKDLKPGMELKGTVRNIVDFGAFVDIGVHQDGLVHISQLADHYVKHPLDVVKVGDIVTVHVLDVDVKREKISLSMRKNPGK